MKKLTTILLLTLTFSTPGLFAEEVNVYSARKENLIKPLLDRFTEQTGIEVNLVTGKADTLIKRLEVEGRNSPADLLITVDAARLFRTEALGLFEPVDSRVLTEAVPRQYRADSAEGNEWYGLSLRSRVIVYAPERVDASELSTYEALADPKWKNRICIRSSSNVYNQSLVASMIAHKGTDATEAWAEGLVENFARKPKGGDRDQIKAVAAGVCDIAVVNTYYLAGMMVSDQEEESAAANKVKLFWPNQAGRGAHMNVSGVGVLRYAPNKIQAIKLMEFLVSDEAQHWYAETNHEYPVKEGIAVSDTLAKWGEFKADDLELSRLGELNKEAVLLMDRVGWK